MRLLTFRPRATVWLCWRRIPPALTPLLTFRLRATIRLGCSFDPPTLTVVLIFIFVFPFLDFQVRCLSLVWFGGVASYHWRIAFTRPNFGLDLQATGSLLIMIGRELSGFKPCFD